MTGLRIMKRMFGLLMVVGLVVGIGCSGDKDSPTGPQGLPVQESWDSGQIRSEGNYQDGNKDGKWVEYYENGQIESEGNYKNGHKDGPAIDYYTDGTK